MLDLDAWLYADEGVGVIDLECGLFLLSREAISRLVARARLESVSRSYPDVRPYG